MFLELSLSHTPGSDLGYLLHKNPNRVHTAEFSFGRAHLFFSDLQDTHATACLWVEIDAVALVRKLRPGQPAESYVNDRAYVPSSYLSVVLAKMLGTAMTGRCKDRPQLADTSLPLRASFPVFSADVETVQRVFSPLGFECHVEPHPVSLGGATLDATRYGHVTLSRCCRLAEFLNQLYVLLPVCDNQKHYFIGDDEVDKIVRHGGEWLRNHPYREEILGRGLKRIRSLVRDAESQYAEEDLDVGEEATDGRITTAEDDLIVPSLRSQRAALATALAKERGARLVADLGCGEGFVLERLLREDSGARVFGVDVSRASLKRCQKRLEERIPNTTVPRRWELLLSSLLLPDERLRGLDVAICSEVMEHIDSERLGDFRDVLFGYHAPNAILLTTPNVLHTRAMAHLRDNGLRHDDHRFEWTPDEFAAWCHEVCLQYPYAVRFSGCGSQQGCEGFSTLAAVFEKREE